MEAFSIVLSKNIIKYLKGAHAGDKHALRKSEGTGACTELNAMKDGALWAIVNDPSPS